LLPHKKRTVRAAREHARARTHHKQDGRFGIVFAPAVESTASSIRKSDITLKLWIFVLGAAALFAARATYNLMSRTPSFGNDQVSSDWLATARIHEDQG
jgi:hypothetical protein